MRGGFALKMDDPGEDAELRRPVLLWPSLLKERPERWALVEAADLLVVDELAWLKKGLQEDLTRAAAALVAREQTAARAGSPRRACPPRPEPCRSPPR